MLGMEDEMELMQAVEQYATAMKMAQQYDNKHGDMDAANNAWHECKKAADELKIGKEMLGKMMAEHGELHDQNKRLRLALEVILDAPGGGPARRIAAQALDMPNVK